MRRYCFRYFMCGCLFFGFNVHAQTNVFPADGSVGIGSISPLSKLDVFGEVSVRNGLRILDYQNIKKAEFYYDNVIDQMYLYGYKPNSIFSVYTGGNRQLDITATGNMGLGTAYPLSKLDVRGEINTINSLKLRDYTSTLKAEFSYDNVIDQMYLYGHRPASFFSIYTGGIRRFDITSAGNVGIGIINPVEKLSVNGNIRAKEIKVEARDWPDYVFDPDYKILSLQELDNYIKNNKHLPEMPNASEVDKSGIEVSDMIRRLLKNQEELTLHLIEKEKIIINLEKRLSEIESKQALESSKKHAKISSP